MSPISSATVRIPRMVSVISSGSSTPSMAAPVSMMERSTPAAKRLSFHFFLTEAASMSRTLFEGRTSAAVVTSPVSSSTA